MDMQVKLLRELFNDALGVSALPLSTPPVSNAIAALCPHCLPILTTTRTLIWSQVKLLRELFNDALGVSAARAVDINTIDGFQVGGKLMKVIVLFCCLLVPNKVC